MPFTIKFPIFFTHNPASWDFEQTVLPFGALYIGPTSWDLMVPME
jgi:hypothetical protein